MSSSSDQSPYPLPASGPPVSGAVIVEDNDLTGAVGFVGDWRTDHDPDYWSGNGSVHYTTGTGYGVLFTFEGTEVWLFGAKFGGTQSGGTIDIRIDDEPATRISTTGESTIPSTLLYSHSVSAGRHVLNVTNVDTSVPLYVDYFAYMPLSSPASAGVTTTSSNPSASVAPDLEPPISVGAAIGITLACVAVLLLLVAFIIFWLRRRRRRRQHVLANVELQSEYAPATDAHPSRAASPFLRPFELDAAPSTMSNSSQSRSGDEITASRPAKPSARVLLESQESLLTGGWRPEKPPRRQDRPKRSPPPRSAPPARTNLSGRFFPTSSYAPSSVPPSYRSGD